MNPGPRQPHVSHPGSRSLSRRSFLGSTAVAAAAVALGGCAPRDRGPRFRLSLAQWSLRDRLRSGALAHADFPVVARDEFGIGAVEYVSTFFPGGAADERGLAELRSRADAAGVRSVLIMVDLPSPAGDLGSPDAAIREAAIEAHRPWLDAAAALGCHAVRVNAQGYGEAGAADAADWFVDGLGRLAEFARGPGLRVLVENHGGHSSNGRWLAGVMERVDGAVCGTLPDFGNFVINRATGEAYDPLLGTRELMPWAGGVSAKSHDFDAAGRETTIDYPGMLGIVRASAFRGHIGIEWGGRGSRLSPEEGVRATKRLLEELLGDDLG